MDNSITMGNGEQNFAIKAGVQSYYLFSDDRATEIGSLTEKSAANQFVSLVKGGGKICT